MILWRITSSTRLAISADQPWLMNGNVSPVSGRSLIFTQTLMAICMKIIEMIPTQSTLSYGSRTRWRLVRNTYANRRYINSNNALPKNPTSSANAAKIKSLCASGMYQNFWSHLPYHLPSQPPPQTDMSACCVCRPTPLPVVSASGLMKYSTLFSMYECLVERNAPSSKNQIIITSTYWILPPAYRYMTIATVQSTSAVPKSGSNPNTQIRSNVITTKLTKNLLSVCCFFFLTSRDEKKKTNPTLKNSPGWMVPPGMVNHAVEPWKVVPIGVNRSNTQTNVSQKMIYFRCLR